MNWTIAKREDGPPKRSLQPPDAPKPADYGLRDFSIIDPWGHNLSFGEVVHDCDLRGPR